MPDPVGLAPELEEPAVVHNAVDYRRGHLVVPEYRPPAAELKVRRDDHRLALVGVGEDLEQQPRPVRVERQEAELVDDELSNPVDMDVMFSGCSSLESLELPRLDSQSLRGLTSTFRGCSSLKTLDLRKVDAPRLYDLDWTFADCSSLQSIDLASSRFSRMESMHRTFYNCSSLQSVDLSNFSTSKVTDMEYMFEGCGSLRSLDLSGLDNSNVSSMRKIFAGCDSLQSLVLPSHGPGLYAKSMFYFSCGESFCMTIGPDIDSYDVTTNSYASFPSIRTGQHLDRIVTEKWVNVNTGEVLASSSIPSCQAATYTPQVIYRSAAPSVNVSGDPCPAESLTATVRIDGDTPRRTWS